jgi:hypothetical protein
MDREKLSEPSNHNKVRPSKRRIKKKTEKPLYPSRQRRWIEKQQGRTQGDNQSNNDDGEDAFAVAFPDVPLRPALTPHQALNGIRNLKNRLTEKWRMCGEL